MEANLKRLLTNVIFEVFEEKGNIKIESLYFTEDSIRITTILHNEFFHISICTYWIHKIGGVFINSIRDGLFIGSILESTDIYDGARVFNNAEEYLSNMRCLVKEGYLRLQKCIKEWEEDFLSKGKV
jgi:hypothetical protein